MIVVLADDFTGAAELAGIGLEYGLSVDIAIEQAEISPETEMLVIATDTRSKGSREAAAEVRAFSNSIKSLPYSLLYKKVDSVMRGHILEEVLAMTETLGIKGALLVPANPQLGRVIIDGHYYINGKSLLHTSFSSDPDFKTISSSVRELLDRNGTELSLEITRPEDFRGHGKIVIGEPYYTKEDVPGELVKFEGDLNNEFELMGFTREEGFEVEFVLHASRDDWDRYVSAGWYGLLQWIDTNPDHPERNYVINYLQKRQDMYFRYQREYEGWVMYILNQRKY